MNQQAQAITIQPPMAGQIGRVFATVLLAATTLLVLGLGVLLIGSGETGFGLLLAATGLFTGLLTWYCLRDCRGKLGWKIVVGLDELTLDLPAGRSLVHRLASLQLRVPFSAIDAIETRHNAYSHLGTCHIHCCYALKLKSGELIILGEDRALSTSLASSFLAEVIDTIALRTDLPRRHLGMAEGGGGALSMLFASPPAWNAPSLSEEQQAAFWQAAAATGQLAQNLAFLPLVTAPVVLFQDHQA